LAGKCRQRGEHILDLEKNQSRLPPHDPEKRDKQRLARITQQSHFNERHRRSIKTLSIHRPLPSMEMVTPASLSAWVNS